MKAFTPQFHRGGPFRLSACRPGKKPTLWVRSLAEIETDIRRLQESHRALRDTLFGSPELHRRQIAERVARDRGITVEQAMAFIPD